jgi:hypothetical protein
MRLRLTRPDERPAGAPFGAGRPGRRLVPAHGESGEVSSPGRAGGFRTHIVKSLFSPAGRFSAAPFGPVSMRVWRVSNSGTGVSPGFPCTFSPRRPCSTRSGQWTARGWSSGSAGSMARPRGASMRRAGSVPDLCGWSERGGVSRWSRSLRHRDAAPPHSDDAREDQGRARQDRSRSGSKAGARRSRVTAKPGGSSGGSGSARPKRPHPPRTERGFRRPCRVHPAAIFLSAPTLRATAASSSSP